MIEVLSMVFELSVNVFKLQYPDILAHFQNWSGKDVKPFMIHGQIWEGPF